MSLTKVNYIDNETIITAQNLNDIQDNIIQNAELIKNVAPRSLLDNSDFTHLVNQRDKTTGNGYVIDRWKMSNVSGIIDIKSGYTNIRSVDGTPLYMFQNIEPGKIKEGKIYTVACEMLDGTIYLKSGEASKSMAQLAKWWADGSIRFNYDSEVGVYYVMLTTSSTSGLNIVNITLYEGEYTENTLPKYHPKGYAAELLECQRYFYRCAATDGALIFGNAKKFSNTSCAGSLIVPAEMQKKYPSVNITGELYVNNAKVTSVSSVRYGNIINFRFTCDASALAYGTVYSVSLESGSAFEISADL